MRLRKAVFIMIFCQVFFHLHAQNQFTTGQDVIRNNYNGLEATYAVVKSVKSSVHVKLKNTTRNTIIIELMITPDGESTKLLPVKIEPGRTEVRNVGDMQSLTTSLGILKPGEARENHLVTQVVDQITKKNDKLTSLKFDSQPAMSNVKADDDVKPAGLSDGQVRAAMELIFTKEEWAQAGPEITDEDKKMALIFLKELVEKSCPMAVVEGVFHFQYAFDFTLTGLARYISDSVEDNCLQKEYESVRKTIAWKYKGSFENRKQNGEWLE